jgi:hypothetical protein
MKVMDRGEASTRGPRMRRRRRALVLVAVVSGVVLTGLGWYVLRSTEESPPAAIMSGTPTPQAPRPEEQAPEEQAQNVHRALHAIGTICESRAPRGRTARVRRHVDTILDFARRYPSVSFPIDDETGTTVSLLIVVRDGVRTCAPSLTGKVNAALPEQYRLSDSSS